MRKSPQIVMWVISTPVVVTRAYITELGLLEPTQLSLILSEWKNINRGVVLLIWNTHTHLCSALVRDREVVGEGGGSVFWVLPFIFWGIYIEEAFAGFFPLGFSQDKYVLFFWCCFFQWSYLYAFLWKWNEIMMS